jgi:hypothetical protein
MNESEGEAGDTRVYAERGIKLAEAKEVEPMPKFEKSVFDMKYTEK